MHRHFTPVSLRLIRDAIWTVKRQRKSLIFISPLLSLPRELEAEATLISYPPPETEQLREMITRLFREDQTQEGQRRAHGQAQAAQREDQLHEVKKKDQTQEGQRRAYGQAQEGPREDQLHEAKKKDLAQAAKRENHGQAQVQGSDPIEGGQAEDPDSQVAEMDVVLRESLAKAVVGLTMREAERVLRRARLTHQGWSEGCVAEVVRQKQQLVRAAGGLEFCEPNLSFEDIGGLSNLKEWFGSRRQAFTPEGARFGLRNPKGAVLVGVPGCGKSLSAKALASEWGVPLLRLDLGRIRGSLLGESEARMRQALQTAELASPCVLWIDELEKAFAGLGNALDSGVGARLFGAFLSWLEDRTAAVFVVATANDITRLPPEFTRKGRFDEVFWVGLPKEGERQAIWKIHLKKPRLLDPGVQVERLVELSAGHTGAEIAEAVISAMYRAFADQERCVTQQDLEEALGEYVPLGLSHGLMISRLMAWGQANARAA